ncbi:MAG TPA: universal stress protein [Gemmatimonadales bacterium]|nr:universal stress protein [Gemmatimonadales bacterium]
MIRQPVVVGVDGSPEAGAAAAAGWRLAQVAGVRCHLVHATHDVRSALDLAGTGVPLDDLQLAMLGRVRAEIKAALGTHVPQEAVEGLIVRVGRSAAVLADVVTETDAGLVVLGGKHHSMVGRWLGGSTVQHAVRRLSVPLLVTAGYLRPRPRVLVAVDLSYAALPTIEHAVAFARLLGGPLRALHVVEPVRNVPEVPIPVDAEQYETQSRERLERFVWPALPVPDHHKVVRRGIAVDVIVEEAAAWRADVVVVGSHGKGWVDRLLIGSATEQLLNDLPTAVLVIPVPAPERWETIPIRTRATAGATA